MATNSPDPLGNANDYDGLPQGIRDAITAKEWAWLTPEERRRYIDNETEPEA